MTTDFPAICTSLKSKGLYTAAAATAEAEKTGCCEVFSGISANDDSLLRTYLVINDIIKYVKEGFDRISDGTLKDKASTEGLRDAKLFLRSLPDGSPLKTSLLPVVSDILVYVQNGFDRVPDATLKDKASTEGLRDAKRYIIIDASGALRSQAGLTSKVLQAIRAIMDAQGKNLEEAIVIFLEGLAASKTGACSTTTPAPAGPAPTTPTPAASAKELAEKKAKLYQDDAASNLADSRQKAAGLCLDGMPLAATGVCNSILMEPQPFEELAKYFKPANVAELAKVFSELKALPGYPNLTPEQIKHRLLPDNFTSADLAPKLNQVKDYNPARRRDKIAPQTKGELIAGLALLDGDDYADNAMKGLSDEPECKTPEGKAACARAWGNAGSEPLTGTTPESLRWLLGQTDPEPAVLAAEGLNRPIDNTDLKAKLCELTPNRPYCPPSISQVEVLDDRGRPVAGNEIMPGEERKVRLSGANLPLITAPAVTVEPNNPKVHISDVVPEAATGNITFKLKVDPDAAPAQVGLKLAGGPQPLTADNAIKITDKAPKINTAKLASVEPGRPTTLVIEGENLAGTSLATLPATHPLAGITMTASPDGKTLTSSPVTLPANVQPGPVSVTLTKNSKNYPVTFQLGESNFRHWLNGLKPELIFSAGGGSRSEAVIEHELPGNFNLHLSLSPEFAGPQALFKKLENKWAQWSLLGKLDIKSNPYNDADDTYRLTAGLGIEIKLFPKYFVSPTLSYEYLRLEQQYNLPTLQNPNSREDVHQAQLAIPFQWSRYSAAVFAGVRSSQFERTYTFDPRVQNLFGQSYTYQGHELLGRVGARFEMTGNGHWVPAVSAQAEIAPGQVHVPDLSAIAGGVVNNGTAVTSLYQAMISASLRWRLVDIAAAWNYRSIGGGYLSNNYLDLSGTVRLPWWGQSVFGKLDIAASLNSNPSGASAVGGLDIMRLTEYLFLKYKK